MVNIIRLLMFFLTLPLQAAELHLTLSSHSVEMGKSITATFEYQGKQSPDIIDLELWKTHFFIEQNDPNETVDSTGTVMSSTKAKLFPRSIGNKTLDAIALGGSFVKPMMVKVLPSIRNNIDATPQIHPSQSHYWADEAITIRVDIPLHDKKNEVIAKDWEEKGFNITPLPSIRSDSYVQLKWLLVTPIKGEYQLELPTIVQRGKGRFRFHSPTINFTIKPLPAYLPSSVATGRIDINSKITTLENNIKQVQLSFTKKGFLPKNIEGVEDFISQLSMDELSLNQQISRTTDQGNSQTVISFNLPNWLLFKTLTLTVRYFDTSTGRLESLNHTLPVVTTVPVIIQKSISLFILLLFAFLCFWSFQTFKQWSHHRNYKRLIHQSSDPMELRSLLLNKGQFKTLNEWADNQQSPTAFELAFEINKHCYALKNKTLPHDLKQALLYLL